MTLVKVVAILDLCVANPAYVCNTDDGCAWGGSPGPLTCQSRIHLQY